ncbi:MAG: YkgJ family cysteine cluster protein [Thermodesulfobacteriota bacterium]
MDNHNPIELSPGDSFRFACHRKVTCFNQCCGDLVQFLTPYDILRLKNRLGLTSGEFLSRYTRQQTGGETGLVVVSLTTGSPDDLRCPFVAPEGCGVYEDRPSSCRSYPLIRLASRSRETEQISERFFLIREDHCLGFDQDRTQTVRQWVEEQGLAEYNRMNDRMMELISAKNRLAPGRSLSLAEANIFYTGCYDLDRFRKEIFETGRLAETGMTGVDLTAAEQDDRALLHLALTWTGRMLFPQQAGA